ncbi:small secreted protein [Seiridium cupressi]
MGLNENNLPYEMKALRPGVLVYAAVATARDLPYLNVTAVTHAKGESVLQCWQLPYPFGISNAPGVANGSYAVIGEVANTTLTVIPANSDGGRHYADSQWVYFITGLAHITLPNSSDEAWINGGKYGLLWAGDPSKFSKHGHSTFYHEQSVTLALMTEGGKEPKHEVVRQGACVPDDLLGMAALGEREAECTICE